LATTSPSKTAAFNKMSNAETVLGGKSTSNYMLNKLEYSW